MRHQTAYKYTTTYRNGLMHIYNCFLIKIAEFTKECSNMETGFWTSSKLDKHSKSRQAFYLHI